MISGSAACPCSSGLDFASCCEPYLTGAKLPPAPEALMRSRYSAFATGNITYLEETLLPGTREDFDARGAADWAAASEWTGLGAVPYTHPTLPPKAWVCVCVVAVW